MRYCFSGHETFYCKSLWLKKGYDYLKEGNSFSDEDAVVKLGVGKNMVASIRFWLKAFGLTQADKLTRLADIIFDEKNGYDKYIEDNTTLWILHYSLVKNRIASLYSLLFLDYQCEKKEFDRDTLNNYIKRRCNVPEQKNVYNENTVRKDIGVLLKNYIAPIDLKSLEDFSALLISLNLLRENNGVYTFNEHTAADVPPSVILYTLLDIKGEDSTISFDKIQEVACIFEMPVVALIEIIREIESRMSAMMHYSDNSGVKNIQFLGDVDKYDVLEKHYNKL